MVLDRRWLEVAALVFSACAIRFYLNALRLLHWENDARIDDSPLEKRKRTDIDSVWRQTTKLLYRDSPHLSEWLSKPPLKLFIYESFAEEFSIHAVSTCIDSKYNADKSNNCGWEPLVCNENSSGTFPFYNLYRTNFNNDVVLLKRFLSYEYVTKDPREADIFIVPYPHKSHCLCRQNNPTKIMCSYSYKFIDKEIIERMEYFKNYTSKHLFIFGSDWNLANPPLRKKTPLHLSLGPADGCRKQGMDVNGNCGSLVVPYVNTDSEYQPNNLNALSRSWWLDRHRFYGLAAIMGTPKHLKVRMEFFENATALLGDNIFGKPIYLSTSANDRNLKRHDIAMDIYRNSTFCPILAGDDTGQKRFFDVILSGCIPVVLQYTSDEKGWSSWFHRNRSSIRRCYPFGRGVFFNDTMAGIDYTSFVVQIDGDCGLKCMKPRLEALLREPDKIRRLRKNLMEAARLLSYGLDQGSYGYPDAFSALLVTLRHYSSHQHAHLEQHENEN